jgi:glucosamine-6-phosphate deaminase
MKIDIRPAYDQMCSAAAELIISRIRQNQAGLVCFPSGETPTGILKLLVKASREGRVDFTQCHFVGLDEWAGLNGTNHGSCRHYLDQHFFIPLNTDPGQIHFFDGADPDLQGQCRRINSFIQEHGPIHLVMVGVGMNGHAGLNEPGVNMGWYAHVSELQENTRLVAEKYFREKITFTHGITLGPRHLLESATLILIASGVKKASVVRRALEGEVSNECPASLIQLHPDAYVFLDQDAGSMLSCS